MGYLQSCIDYLMNYPLEETPYPKGYPEDLRFDHYPGQDFVVGLCDETISDFMVSLTKQKNPEARELIKDYIKLFKDIRQKRLAKLGAK